MVDFNNWFLRIGNYIIGTLWILAGLFLLKIKPKYKVTWGNYLAPFLLVAFGLSDYIESLTSGIWWDPPALLFLKIICAFALFLLTLDKRV